MFTEIMFAVATGIMVGLGIFQLLRRDLIKAAMGLSTLFIAINLFFFSVGAFDSEAPAYEAYVEQGQQVSDPLVQALVLTAIVVSFGSYALLLGMVNIASRRYNTVDSDEVNELTN